MNIKLILTLLAIILAALAYVWPGTGECCRNSTGGGPLNIKWDVK